MDRRLGHVFFLQNVFFLSLDIWYILACISSFLNIFLNYFYSFRILNSSILILSLSFILSLFLSPLLFPIFHFSSSIFFHLSSFLFLYLSLTSSIFIYLLCLSLSSSLLLSLCLHISNFPFSLLSFSLIHSFLSLLLS